MMEDDSVRFWQEWQNQFEQELLELEAAMKADKEKAKDEQSI